MLWPVPGYYTVTSGFADTRSYGMHAGFDIGTGGANPPTVAVDNGIVIYTGWAGSAGRSVYVELEGGYRAHYCHLSRIDMVVGQAVAAGDVIGLVGGSGYGVDNYYGSHLHFNLFVATQPATGPSHWVTWVGMWAIDPELYLGQEGDMDEATVRRIVREEVNSHNDLSRHLNIGEIEDTLQGLNDQLKAQVRQIAQEEATGGGAGYTDKQAIKAVKDKLS